VFVARSIDRNDTESAEEIDVFARPPFVSPSALTDFALPFYQDEAQEIASTRLPPATKISLFPTRELMMSKVTPVESTRETAVAPVEQPQPQQTVDAPAPPQPQPSRGLEGELVSLLETVIHSQQSVNHLYLLSSHIFYIDRLFAGAARPTGADAGGAETRRARACTANGVAKAKHIYNIM